MRRVESVAPYSAIRAERGAQPRKQNDGDDGTINRRSNRSRQDLRDARDRFLIRSGGEVVVGEAVVVEGDGGGHDTLAVAGDSVAASAWDLGDEAVAAEFDDEP